MSTDGTIRREKGKKRKSPTGRHVRFSEEIIRWIEVNAADLGFNSDADLIRHAVREYRQSIERGQAASA